jgi:hypothetical protein
MGFISQCKENLYILFSVGSNKKMQVSVKIWRMDYISNAYLELVDILDMH